MIMITSIFILNLTLSDLMAVTITLHVVSGGKVSTNLHFPAQTYLLDNDVSSFCMFELSVPTDNLKFSVKYFKDFQEETSNKMFCLTCSREMELHSENNELLLLNRSINCVYCFLKAPGIQTN